jgi:hypothetical protein
MLLLDVLICLLNLVGLLLVEGLHQKVVQERLGIGEPAQLGLVCLVEPSLAVLVVQAVEAA